MKKRDVSIEYAHIYTNNKINDEHTLSLSILGEITQDLQQKQQSFSLVVLVDDYSFPDPSFDYKSFTAWLSEHGFPPDVVFRESQLIPLCDQVLQSVNNQKLHEQLTDYIKTKKYPCSLFVAAWYLLRLGHLSYEMFQPEWRADRLINILPESFKPFEDKALEIMANTQFSGAEKQVEHRYFEGRFLA